MKQKGATAAVMSTPTQLAQTPGSRGAPKAAGPPRDPDQDTQGPRALQGPHQSTKTQQGDKAHMEAKRPPIPTHSHTSKGPRTSWGPHRQARANRETDQGKGESKSTKVPEADHHIARTAKQAAKWPKQEGQKAQKTKPNGTEEREAPKAEPKNQKEGQMAAQTGQRDQKTAKKGRASKTKRHKGQRCPRKGQKAPGRAQKAQNNKKGPTSHPRIAHGQRYPMPCLE